MSRFKEWAEQRFPLPALRRALIDRPVPDRLTVWHALGAATLTAFLVQVATGVVLATYYVPAPDHAYDSIRFIQREVALGALLRGMHHWGASTVVVLIVAHMIRVFSIGAYKYPREANWLVGVGLFIVVMGLAFTGYLLPWDQRAYWATVVGTSLGRSTPVVGAAIQAVLRGGANVGAATLTRFYAFHTLWFPALVGGLALLHLALVVYHGHAPRAEGLEPGAPARTTDAGYDLYYREAYAATQETDIHLWPDMLARYAVVSCLVVIIIVALGATVGAGLELPADPNDANYVPKPEWYFLPLYELMKLVPGSMESLVGVGVPAGLVIVLLALPFFDRKSARSLRHRPLALGSLAVLLGSSGLLIGAALRPSTLAPPPDTGAPLTTVEHAGRALFWAQQCTLCHRIRNEGGNVGPDLSEVGLHHSVAWMHSFIEDPRRFHAQTPMPPFAPPRLSHQEIEELAQYLGSLRGSSGLAVEPQFSDTFPP